MIVGGYTLNLYCDNAEAKHHSFGRDGKLTYMRKVKDDWHEFAFEFTGKNKTQAETSARGAGWLFDKEIAVCPICKAHGVTLKKVKRTLTSACTATGKSGVQIHL